MKKPKKIINLYSDESISGLLNISDADSLNSSCNKGYNKGQGKMQKWIEWLIDKEIKQYEKKIYEFRKYPKVVETSNEIIFELQELKRKVQKGVLDGKGSIMMTFMTLKKVKEDV